MTVKSINLTMDDLRSRLHSFEELYGLPSEKFIEAFRNGELEETEDFMDWSHAYTAFKLATAPRS